MRLARRLRAAALAAACLAAACAEYLGTSFSEIAPPEIAGRDVRPGARCRLDAAPGADSDAPRQPSRQRRVHLHGWAIDGATLTHSAWVVVRLTRAGGGASYYAVTWARGGRDDLARELGPAAGAAQAGFDIVGTLQLVPPGAYDVDLIVAAPSGPVSCATGRRLVVV
jgi:hypothetical protein